jgi:hypothetical protein
MQFQAYGHPNCGCLSPGGGGGNANGQRDYVQAAFWFQKAVEQGISARQYNLGVLNANGPGGLPKDDERAVYWLRRVTAGTSSIERTLTWKRQSREI